MWQIYAIIAQDLIRDRQAEAEAEARYHRLLLADHGVSAVPVTRPGLLRRLSAGALRRVEAGAAWISRRASSTASRLEGEPA